MSWSASVIRVLLRAARDSTLLLVALLCLLLRKRREELIWGPMPLINNRYWSEAMKAAGWPSKTLVEGYYAINRREDFDVLFEDFVPARVRGTRTGRFLGQCAAMAYVINRARVLHIPFSGGVLGQTCVWWIEALILKVAGIKTVVLPYGGDALPCSLIRDPSMHHALLISYPGLARTESIIRRRMLYWAKHADCVVCGFMIDGMPRWDVPVPNMLALPLTQWQGKSAYSSANGRDGIVRVLHTPNHRGAKGTEFLIQAVSQLREEGLRVELVLLERVPNEKVRLEMQAVDLLAEQFVMAGFGLSAIEGLASGLPVLANLEDEASMRLFRRYAFLDECPVVSTTPETLKETLRALVSNPGLREELGRAGRAYAEKYHSYETAQFLFGSIYRKILQGEEVDLMNLFHPLKSQFNARLPRVEHPLKQSRLPPSYPCSAG